jgi:hypothetical protein
MRRSTALAILVLSPGALAQSGGIEIFAGETIFAKGTRLSVSYLYDQKTNLYEDSNKVSDPQQQEFRRQRLVLGYNYGWTSRVTVGALLPLEDADEESLGTHSTGDAGVGDLALFGKYRIYTRDRMRNSFNISAIGGIELPTGHTGLTGPQPGSGSWDPFAALAATNSVDRFRYDAQVIYKWNTEGTGGLNDSDEWGVTVSAAYRYLHRPYPGASNSAKLGLSWQEDTHASRGGVDLANSGSESLFLSPALGFHPVPAIDISFKVDIPLYQHYDGLQLGYDFRAFLAFGYRF